MRAITLLLIIFSVQIKAESLEDQRNQVLFEKLHSQNQKLWSFINSKKKNETENKMFFTRPSELKIAHLKPNVSNKLNTSTQKGSSDTLQDSKVLQDKTSLKKQFPNYLIKDPADDDLLSDDTGQFDQPLRPKGWQSDDQPDVKNKSSESSSKKFNNSTEITKNELNPPLKVVLPKVVSTPNKELNKKPNALQRAWTSLMSVAKSIGRPQPLSKATQRRNFKTWSFQIGLRNLINNDSDGFRHDAEVYHQLGYRIDDRQKIFVERKTVTMTGEGFGKVARTGVGYQHYLKSVNEESDFYPYFALFYDHWKGNFDNFNGVPIVNGKNSRDILTTRLGLELPLTNTTNLDIYWERGKKFLNFTDALGTKIEIHARNNLYGMGLSHSF